MTNLHIMVRKNLRKAGLVGVLLVAEACGRIDPNGIEVGAFDTATGFNVSRTGTITGLYANGATLRDGLVNPTSSGYEVRLGGTDYLVPLNSSLGLSLAGAIATEDGFTSTEFGSNLGSRLSQYRVESSSGDERQDNNDSGSDDDGSDDDVGEDD